MPRLRRRDSPGTSRPESMELFFGARIALGSPTRHRKKRVVSVSKKVVLNKMESKPTHYSHFFPAVRSTRLPGGYMGKILRVDLSTGKLTDLNLPEEPLLRKYWGGQLFAEYVLLNELPLEIDPYDSRNIIVGMTGPVTGTG